MTRLIYIGTPKASLLMLLAMSAIDMGVSAGEIPESIYEAENTKDDFILKPLGSCSECPPKRQPWALKMFKTSLVYRTPKQQQTWRGQGKRKKTVHKKMTLIKGSKWKINA